MKRRSTTGMANNEYEKGTEPMKADTKRIRRSSSRLAWKIRWLPVSALLALPVAASAATASADGPPLCQDVCATALVPLAPGPAEPFGVTSCTRGPSYITTTTAYAQSVTHP